MATITPTRTVHASSGYTTVTGTGVSTADTMTAIGPLPGDEPLRGTVQIIGTFGGATITVAGSNAGTTYSTLKDLNSTEVSATAAAAFEISTCFPYLNVTSSGGAADDVDVSFTFRG